MGDLLGPLFGALFAVQWVGFLLVKTAGAYGIYRHYERRARGRWAPVEGAPVEVTQGAFRGARPRPTEEGRAPVRGRRAAFAAAFMASSGFVVAAQRLLSMLPLGHRLGAMGVVWSLASDLLALALGYAGLLTARGLLQGEALAVRRARILAAMMALMTVRSAVSAAGWVNAQHGLWFVAVGLALGSLINGGLAVVLGMAEDGASGLATTQVRVGATEAAPVAGDAEAVVEHPETTEEDRARRG